MNDDLHDDRCDCSSCEHRLLLKYNSDLPINGDDGYYRFIPEELDFELVEQQ